MHNSGKTTITWWIKTTMKKMNGGVGCPKGCGDLEYKIEYRNRNSLFGVGFFFAFFGLLISFHQLTSTETDDDILFPCLVGIFGLGVILYGFSVRTPTRLKCGVCKGVLIETKEIDVLLKKEAGYFRKRLELSKNSSSYDCPDCHEKMSEFVITARQKTDFTSLGGFVVSALSNDKRKVIDGCSMCDLFWLDVDEEVLLSGDQHKIIR
tara:strand:- start:1950 stop:2573 length:624 start_codon:yes stop_codon:yes gene_type:complete